MRAIVVSVDYADVLSLTLAYNRHHFESVTVVTCERDTQTRLVAQMCGADVFVTEAFYDDGADFNKWKALEQGLDHMGRHGWLCIMDADVCWPRRIMVPADGWQVGCLYTPNRRMCTEIPETIPAESSWQQFPHHHVREFSGFTQILHGDDSHLPAPPWHQTGWKHAGGADTFFQSNWPSSAKIRPPWEVLHLGEPGVNWCGVGGNKTLQRYMDERRRSRRYDHEWI